MAKGRVGHIEGMKECREALQELDKIVQLNVGKRALKPAAAILIAAVKARAKVSGRAGDKTPGSLKASVKEGKAKSSKGRARMIIIADDVAAVPQEFGLSRRDYPAEPFFRPAVDANRDRAAGAVAEALKVEVDAAAQRVARKAAK